MMEFCMTEEYDSEEETLRNKEQKTYGLWEKERER